VDLEERILAANEARARHNREHFLSAGVLAVNVMGSPGSGKTAVLEGTARALRGSRRLLALAGDLTTDLDARRLEGAGIRSRSISTGSACHLDAEMVHHAVHDLALAGGDYLFIENVGNLVCPAVFDLGQAVNVVVLSVTEGPDKPLKYPVMFRKADAVLLAKADLLPALPGVRLEDYLDNLARVAPEPRVWPVAALTAGGLEPWIDWLETRRAELSGAWVAEGLEV
jgi:hydrogenase nickel incorporation protein HypB